MTTEPTPESAFAQPLAQPPKTEVRYLTPETCFIHLGSYGTLHVTIPDEWVYGGVYAVYAFPVAHKDRFISLLHRVPGSEDVEIGVIRDLTDFPPEQARLVRRALQQRYFIHTITRIHEIRWKYGLVALKVDTDKGPVDFLMRWKIDRAVDYGEAGKVLIDLDENRYLIPDLRKLTPRELADFTRIIYW